MKKLKTFAIALALVLGLTAGIFAISRIASKSHTHNHESASCCADKACCAGGACKTSGACCAKHNNATAHASTAISYENAAGASCCGDASCCKDGVCKMNGSCCGGHKTQAVQTGVATDEGGKSCHQNKTATTLTENGGESCCGHGAACCAGGGGVCCKTKNQAAKL